MLIASRMVGTGNKYVMFIHVDVQSSQKPLFNRYGSETVDQICRAAARTLGSHSRYWHIRFILRLCCPVWVAALRWADSPLQGVLQTVCKIHSFRLILNGNGQGGLIRQRRSKEKKNQILSAILSSDDCGGLLSLYKGLIMHMGQTLIIPANSLPKGRIYSVPL
jgi:hypothetical protein